MNDVANGLIGGAVALAHIPPGTVNVYALETGIPFDPGAAVDLIFDGRRVDIYPGNLNGRFFLFAASAGFDAEVVENVNLNLKKRLGRVAYLFSALKIAFRGEGAALEIETGDKKIIRAYQVVVGKMKYYAGSFSVTPTADFTSDEIVVAAFTKTGLLNVARYLWGIYRGSHIDYDDVEYFSVKNLKITSQRPACLQMDGDPAGHTPAVFSVSKQPVTVIIP